MRAFFNQLLTKSPLCLCCGYQKNYKHGFCLGCYHDLPHIKTPCLQCGLPLKTNTPCTCKAEDWPFAACLSAFEYQFPINELVFQYKSQARLALCDSFAQALITQIKKQQHPLPQVLMPVPLHPNKLKQRGFNQSLELAKALSKQLHIPIDYHSLQSTQQTTQQKSLNKQQRLVNVQSSYALTRPLSVTHIALIDDVITTGATTKTLAYLLREHGATQIQAWSIARTASFNS
ncbi:MAG: ComF family protein [Moraxellaceae bacterium]|nr:ComF family protein [Moraxellaceae bacterium]